MNFLEKIDALMKECDLNKNTLSQESGIPYTTIDGWYKKGYSNARLPTIQKLADYFDTTLDYLIRDEITDKDFGKTFGFEISVHEKNLIKKYRGLDTHGKKAVDWIAEHELDRLQGPESPIGGIIENATTAYSKIIPFPGKVSAGLGVEAIPNYDTIAGPDAADFALLVDGDSMEPRYHSGQIIYIKKQLTVENGQIAVVQVYGNDDFDPRAYLKQIYNKADCARLVSLNHEYADIEVPYKNLTILGTVIN